ncbi:DUF4097 family beta strand repeat-containing protein [Streptomyces fuscigenes]|uniref:DUF4097 family beta strand repeat-containing protein n=1 Tax=Streptomyces fuscigenes TaxID=1528880 RepID=UPI001F333CE3|nr:DUF4097 family beta strand repeat-containing protein [Streptomyces fuscigenes]MCF3960930.1 DUF4097 domain-containing protein [Streptomyces fuscigenes]
MTTAARPRKHTHAVLAVCGVAVLAATATACGSDPSDAPVQKHTFAFTGKKLTIKADDSSVRIVPGDVTGIHVQRQVQGWVFVGTGPSPSWRLEGDTLTLKVKCAGLTSDCNARHTVTVPRDVAVTVTSGNGSVTAKGFRTAVTLDTSNGSAEVWDSSGPVSLSSHNGSVTGVGLTGSKVSASSSNGSIRLGFSSVPDDVHAVSDNGRIQIGLPKGHTAYAVDAGSNNGHTDIGVPRDDASPHSVKARASNGGISVRALN